MAVQKNYVDDKPVDHSAAFAKRMGWSNHQKPPQNGNGSMIGCLVFVCALIALLIASARSEIHFLLKCVRKTWLAVVAE